MSDKIPRRICIDLMTPPETAIRQAMVAVEAMAADVRLTRAGQHLQQALAEVSSYVDERLRDHDLGP